MAKKKESSGLARSKMYDAVCVGDENYPKVIEAIRRYRWVCRHIAAIACTVEAACSEAVTSEDGFLKINMGHEESKKILAHIFKKQGKAYIYELRDYVKTLLPEWKSCMVDGVLRNVASALMAKDAEKNNARRNFLVTVGMRTAPGFRFSEMPIPNKDASISTEKNGVRLKWNFDVDKVEFRWLGARKKSGGRKLDPGRSYTWHKLSTKEWKMGSVYLNERDGKLKVRVTYHEPERQSVVDESRVLEVAYDPDNKDKFLSIKLVKGGKTLLDDIKHRELSALAALDRIDDLETRARSTLYKRSACGSKVGGSGLKSAARHYDGRRERITKQRTNVVKNWNHLWSSRIILLCKNNRAGSLVVSGLPAKLFERPWQWFQFKEFVKYKAKADGIKVKFASPEMPKELEKSAAS